MYLTGFMIDGRNYSRSLVRVVFTMDTEEGDLSAWSGHVNRST